MKKSSREKRESLTKFILEILKPLHLMIMETLFNMNHSYYVFVIKKVICIVVETFNHSSIILNKQNIRMF